MKNVKLQLAVFTSFGLLSMQSQAGMIDLPVAGFPASGGDPASAYTRCYADGRFIPPLAGPATTPLAARSNFGSLLAAGSSGVCELTGLANDAVGPLPGYGAAITANIQNILSPSNTIVGTVTERVWRKLAATAPATTTNMCIIGTKVTVNNNLYDTTLLEVNDIARGGYSGLTVNVGYGASSSNSVVHRVGRTFTSVQHRAYIYGGGTLAQKQNNGTNYLDIPPNSGTGPNISGINTPLAANTIAPAAGSGQQEALVNQNWVDFTVDASAAKISAMTYIQFNCGTNTDNAATIRSTWRQAGALRLRRTAQENTTFADIVMTGYAPPGATVP